MSKKVMQTPGEYARKAVEGAFRTFDTDHSGYIEFTEFRTLMYRLTEAYEVDHPSDSDIKDLFEALDKNNDKSLSKIEFDKLVEKVVKIIQECS